EWGCGTVTALAGRAKGAQEMAKSFRCFRLARILPWLPVPAQPSRRRHEPRHVANVRGRGLAARRSARRLPRRSRDHLRPRGAPFTAPIYAALEGLVLGALSALFEAMYPGIVIQAVGLSVGVLAVMLFVYGTGIIRATEKFKIGVVAATGAVGLVYLVDIVLSLFGTRLPFIHESGMVGIGFSLVVVVIAALNLILDFDFIEQGARLQAPKYMEWYGGFSLLVTLVWMYLEILRLLAKLKDSRG